MLKYIKLIHSKKVYRFAYYWLLCMLLTPTNSGYDPYKNSPFKRFLTKIVPGNNRGAVRLIIYGKVCNSGYDSWLMQKARLGGLECLALNRCNVVEAVVIGFPDLLANFNYYVWKGPPVARVENVSEKWFNKPSLKKNDFKEQPKKVSIIPKQNIHYYKDNVSYLGLLLKEPNYFTSKGKYSNTEEIIRILSEKKVFSLRFDNALSITTPTREIGIYGSQSSRVSSMVRFITDDKNLTKKVLSQRGLPVPVGAVFSDLDIAKKYFQCINRPLVVKPIRGSYGLGVTIDVTTEIDLEVAWNYAKRYHTSIALEELYQGIDIRLMVIGGIAKAALLRIPANVIGDGHSTISVLINIKNQQRMHNPRLCKAMLMIDFYTEQFLARQGHSLQSVPRQGEVIFLHQKANIGAGADSVVVTEHIHKDLMSMAEEAASTFGAFDFLGVDIIAESLQLSRYEQKCCIIEVNTKANIYNVTYPLYGEPFNAAAALISHLLPETAAGFPYRVVNKRILIEGFLGNDFVVWIERQATFLELQGQADLNSNSAEIRVCCREDVFLSLISSLYSWQNYRHELVDNIFISGHNRKIYEDFIINVSYSNSNIQKKEIGRTTENLKPLVPNDYNKRCYALKDIINVDLQLLFEECLSRGLEANVCNDELIEISFNGQVCYLGKQHSSLFCDKVCGEIYPARLLLLAKGFPVSRGFLFRVNELNAAINYYKKIEKTIYLTTIYNDNAKSCVVKSVKELSSLWQEGIEKGSNKFFLEQCQPGMEVIVAIAKDEAVAAIFLKPIEFIGDGSSKIIRLIEKKNDLREKNTYYQNKKIVVNKVLIKNLKSKGYGVNDILEPGEILCLGSESTLEQGGETRSAFRDLHESFYFNAIRAVKVVPGLEFACVNMIIPDPMLPADQQEWVIKKIDTKPSMAMFHFPWEGEPQNIAEVILKKFLHPGK